MNNNIRQYRKNKNLTQYQLAYLTGIGRVNITRYETGVNNVPIKNAMKIAKALECTLDELLGLDTEEGKNSAK